MKCVEQKERKAAEAAQKENAISLGVPGHAHPFSVSHTTD